MNNSYLAAKPFLMVAGLLLATSSVQAALPLVEIKTYGQHIGGNIVYTHLVSNNSTCKIAAFTIAEDTDYINSKLPVSKALGELSYVFPIGYTNMGSEEVDASSVSGLPNWQAEIIQIEHGGLYLDWQSDQYRDDAISAQEGVVPGQDIYPGQVARFSVTVPKIDWAYVKGHFSAELWGGACPSRHNDVMQSLDTTPPVLTVTLTPATITAAQRGLMIPVTATITVKDDYDPAPEIKLVSVLADDPANGIDIQGDAVDTDDRSFSVRAARFNPAVARTYQVIYSATDASGNTSTATVNLLVN